MSSYNAESQGKKSQNSQQSISGVFFLKSDPCKTANGPVIHGDEHSIVATSAGSLLTPVLGLFMQLELAESKFSTPKTLSPRP